VRIEDVDRGRELPGAADDILRTLERFGLTWDGPVLYQSTRADAYEAALERLRAAGLVYACSCSRTELGEAGGAVYPGYCRTAPRHPEAPLALRLRTAGFAPLTAHDQLQGELTEDVSRVTGDFVLRRRDGFYAYQLAVVVDDADQGITDVVRGLDLWDNTPRQLLLQQVLGLPTPRYAHVPLVVDRQGRKLSKADEAPAADAAAAAAVQARVLRLLGHAPPPELHAAPPAEQLEWARSRWDIRSLQGVTRLS
jgi:glutamyl-Q tRNA(Asp) synthetase